MLVDEKLRYDVEPYIREIRRVTSETNLARERERLEKEVDRFHANGWIYYQQTTVKKWVRRVKRLRKNTELINLRIHPYGRVPSLLDGQSRDAVLRTAKVLSSHLRQRANPRATKRIVEEFLNLKRKRSLKWLERKFEDLARSAKESLG